MSGPLEDDVSVLGDADFIGPVLRGVLNGLNSGLGSICSLRVRTEPSLPC